MDTEMILWGLLFGSIGMGYFMYGKKQDNAVIRYTGLVLMIYPYFISNSFALVVVGILLLLLPKFIKL